MTSAPALMSWYFHDNGILVTDFVQTNGFCSANMFALTSMTLSRRKKKNTPH